MIRIGIYIGIGVLLHLLFVGATFEWSSAWTWLWLFAWPVMLFLSFWAVVLSVAVVGLLIYGGLALAGRA